MFLLHKEKKYLSYRTKLKQHFKSVINDYWFIEYSKFRNPEINDNKEYSAYVGALHYI